MYILYTVCVQPSWAAVDVLLVIVAGLEAFVAMFAAALACRSICSGRLSAAAVRTVHLLSVCCHFHGCEFSSFLPN